MDVQVVVVRMYTGNDELTFSAPYSWDISLSNLSEAITGSNKIYTLTGLMSVARYGNQNLPIGLNLDNILQALQMLDWWIHNKLYIYTKNI